MNIFQKIICIIRFKLLKHKLSKFGEVHYINGSETLPAPLKKNEEELVMKKLAEGDESARETLITHNLRLVVYIAKKFESKSASVEDLISIGTIGLIKAVDNFNMEYDVRFSTYAVPMITGEIKRFLRDDGIIKVSRSIKENSYKCMLASEKLKTVLNREPTLEEISEETGIGIEDIIVTHGANETVESICKTVYQKDGNEICLLDKLEGKDNYSDRVVDNVVVRELIAELSEREQKIIKMRYFDDYTQTQVADILGISQVQVSRLEKKILVKMRNNLM